MNVKELPSEP